MVASVVDDPYTANAKRIVAETIARLSREELFALAARIEKASKNALFEGIPSANSP